MSIPVPAQVSGSTGDTVLSRRDKSRLATVAEIKATALQLMRDSGTTDARFTDIARVMGMTPPALYRYFGDSDGTEPLDPRAGSIGCGAECRHASAGARSRR